VPPLLQYDKGSVPRVISAIPHLHNLPGRFSFSAVPYLRPDVVMAVAKNIGCYVHPLSGCALGRIKPTVYLGLNILNYDARLSAILFHLYGVNIVFKVTLLSSRPLLDFKNISAEGL
jgi:hypothetical protein